MSKSLQAFADEVSGACIASRVRTLSRLITNLYQSEMASEGPTIAQFNVLTALVKMGEATPTSLVSALKLEKSTLSRNLALMRENGWIDQAGKGRSVIITLTPRGENLFRTAYSSWKKAQDKAGRLLGKAAIKAFSDAAAALAPG